METVAVINPVKKIEIPYKDLSQKAILIELSISRFGGYKKHKKATKDITSQNNADEKRATVSVKLLKNDLMNKVVNAEQNIRNFFRKNTSPWSEGCGIIPITNYVNFKQGLEDLKREFQNAVDNLVSEYQHLVDSDRIALGDLFVSGNYPSKEAFKSSFGVVITPRPVLKTDFRSNALDDAEIENINNAIEERVKDSIRNIHIDGLGRVLEKLDHLKDRLSVKEGKFHDSAIDNVREAIAEVRNITIDSSPEVEAVFNSIESTLSNFNSEVIREKANVKSLCKDATSEMIKEVTDTMAMFGYDS